MNGRVIRRLLAVLVLGAVLWLFPPFHIIRLKSRPVERPATFDPAAFAADFWQSTLPPACGRAPQLADLLQLLNRDPGAARKRFGHSPGLGSTTLFLVQGSGRVNAVDEKEIGVELTPVANVKLALVTGLIFGNAVRDGTGLLDPSAFSNSQQFNDISTELNRLVETKVLPDLRQHAAAGKEIRFAGCFELEDGPLPQALQIIPIKVEWP